MAHSDIQYDSDSDLSDNVDQLSPTDGYFPSTSSSNAVPSVPNVMATGPTVLQSETTAESKAREANDERRRELLNSRMPQQQQSRDSAYPAYTYNTYSYNTYNAHAHSPSSWSPLPRTRGSTPREQPLRTLPSAATGSRGRTPSVYSDAPPAYTPSPTSPLFPTATSRYLNNYTTIGSSNMGVENERLLGRDPESMVGGQMVDQDRYTPRWSRQIRRRLPPWLSLRMLLLAVVLLVVSVGFLASSYRVFKGDKNSNKNTIKPSLPAEGVKDGSPAQPGQPESPPTGTSPGLGSPNLAPLQPTYCKNATYRFPEQIMGVKFESGRNLSFLQVQHPHSGSMHVKVGGQVNIRQLDAGGDPRVVLEIVTNDKELRLDVLADEVDQAMEVSVPKKFDGTVTGEEPCVEMRATLWVPEGGQIELLNIGVTQLDILMLDDVSMTVGDYSRISTVTGNIVSGADKPRTYETSITTNKNPDYTFVPAKQTYNFDSRIIEAQSTSGSISGNWPLYDMLGLHSTAGNIKVSITPYPVLESHPRPAVLSMSSVSGSIQASEPVHLDGQIPMREYLVDIHSTSGGIHGAFAFSTGCTLKSTASNIAVDLLPVMNETLVSPSQPAQLETTSTSGVTAVRVLEPMWLGQTSVVASRPFDCLQAIHKSASADVGLRYPESYLGAFYAETKSGQLKVKGKDVKITKSVGGFPGSTVVAYKGKSEGASIIEVRTLMGSTDAIIGDQ